MAAKDLAKEKWKSSGITDAQAKKLRLTALTPEQTLALGPTFKKVESL